MLEDERILDLYWARDDSAIQETSTKYGARLLRLASRMLRVQEDSEECVNDTYLGTWNSVPPQRPEHFFSYLARLCRNLACNRLDWLNAAKRSADITPLTDELSACIPDTAADREADSRELGAALNSFLKGLSTENRVIFMRRYWFMDTVSEIAERYGITESKVKTSLFRSRKKLREYLEREEISI